MTESPILYLFKRNKGLSFHLKILCIWAGVVAQRVEEGLPDVFEVEASIPVPHKLDTEVNICNPRSSKPESVSQQNKTKTLEQKCLEAYMLSPPTFNSSHIQWVN